ncbi:hypothetical protein GCM10010112_24740 [Actinoplanes lobatus]|uniref:Nitroreductase n=1 Tax=Actinoplanes lobatus TaxID=113568 RepID=A0A7W7MIK9_9ACTN|nr:hypothetical protein [Actinoplanes lobatus]MBB4751516.1 nitroreductase [Actinoplanes lobatus]GGN64474.1 hypothetical protein GCM10010112_24740 [Actinoplanes lobatus]GIE41125.1 hypothetical protein Alo02nite_40230 [Actinoplanes lobatus]
MVRIGPDTAEFLVGASVRAPSVYNTQPWRFAHRDDGTIEVWADRCQALPAADPAGRELVISCGAALATLVLGIRWFGHQAVVRRLPDPAQPNLLAHVAAGPAYSPGQQELDMFHAVLDRHTHRGRFADIAVAPALLARLTTLARSAGVRACLIRDQRKLRRMTRLTTAAQRIQLRQPPVQDELTYWLRAADTPERDGIVSPEPDPPAGTTPVRFRDTRPDALPDRRATTILLASGRDDPMAWLRAGEALQRMLLHAARHGVNAAIYTQPLEVPSVRARMAALTGGGYPQMLFQLGRSRGVSTAARRTPAEVLVPAAPSLLAEHG